MNFTSGRVIRTPRSATSNAATTDEAQAFVVRDTKPRSVYLTIPGPAIVSPNEAAYASSVLAYPEETTEVALWAASSGNLWGQAGFVVTPNASFLPDPTNLVGDLTRQILLQDPSGRGLRDLVSLQVSVEDQTYDLLGQGTFNPVSGVFTLQNSILIAALGGGFSVSRGDVISSAQASLAGPLFWWSMNDPWRSRIYWQGTRWVPLPGAGTSDLGKVSRDINVYTLSPLPQVEEGQTLPGNADLPDSYSMLRVGISPDRFSTPLAGPSFAVQVVSPQAFEDFVYPAGVVGVMRSSDGAVKLSPSAIAQFEGLHLYYSPREFPSMSTGSLGPLSQGVWYIAPIPEGYEHPLIRIGQRAYLQSRMVDSETIQDATPIAPGEALIARSTGRLKLSEAETELASDPAYLEAHVFYDGVVLSSVPVSMIDPLAVTDAVGNETVIDSQNELYVGLSQDRVAGVQWVPDGTGTPPNTSATPTTRPNGSGLVRSVEGPWDTFVYTDEGVLRSLRVVLSDEDIPKFLFKIPEGTALLDLRPASEGRSQIILGRQDRQRFRGRTLYFSQAIVTLSYYVDEALIWGTRVEPFDFEGGEIFTFALNGEIVVWVASPGSFSAQDVADSIAALVGDDRVTAELGRLGIHTNVMGSQGLIGTVEIGGFEDPRAASILGFCPGWICRIQDPPQSDDIHWLTANGVSFGLYRSPLNLDGSAGIPDFNSLQRVDDAVLIEEIPASSVILLQEVPLEDIPGYAEDVFFQIQRGLQRTSLQRYQDLWYRFEEKRMLWLGQTSLLTPILQPQVTFSLGAQQVVPAVLNVAIALPGGELTPQVLGEDYLLVADGVSGLGVPIRVLGKELQSGQRGVYVQGSGTFVDADVVSWNASPGDHLDILQGQEEGTYTIVAVDGASLQVSPPFAGSSTNALWRVVTAPEEGIIADASYVEFTTLEQDPYQVRILSSLGILPDTSQATLGQALIKGRPLSIRLGLPASSPTRTIIFLEVIDLGVAGGALEPIAQGIRLQSRALQIRVGSKTYAESSQNLFFVVSLTPNLQGDVVEVDVQGEIGLGSGVLSLREGASVYEVETFLDPVFVQDGTVEMDLLSGSLNFTATDVVAFAGTPVYLVEDLSAGVDVTLNPIQGSLALGVPLRDQQIVEVSYFLAQEGSGDLVIQDGLPVQVIEFLGIPVSLEVAVPQGDLTWSFNPSGRTIDTSFSPLVYVGTNLANIGSSVKARIEGSLVILETPTTDVVRVTYAVYESFGGEQTFTVSSPPVYRPPLRIAAAQTSFEVEGDRTTSILPGEILRVAATTMYIVSTAYLLEEDKTLVTIFPAPLAEIGSRDPGANSLSVLSDRPVRDNPSFWEEIEIRFDPIQRGYQSIVFRDVLPLSVVAGQILEIGGEPYTITGVDVTMEATALTVASPFTQGFAFGADAVRISKRPIYPPNFTIFIDGDPTVETEPYSVLFFPPGKPGEALLPGVDVEIDLTTTTIQLLSRVLGPGDSIYMRRTEAVALAPAIVDGSVQNPVVRVTDTSFVQTPGAADGRLGAVLYARFSYRAPDTWHTRIVPLSTWMGEVVAKVGTATAGPAFGSSPILPSPQEGLVGIRGEIEEARQEDRASRHFLAFYHSVITSWDTVLETIDGRAIGDRDGRFRYQLVESVPPKAGCEDPISGDMTPRLVFSEVFTAYAPGVYSFLERDPVVDPAYATLQDGIMTGPFIDPDFLSELISSQREYIRNDIDDTVLIGRTRKRVELGPLRIEAFGRYGLMGSPHALSRLYPEHSGAFTTTDPGLLSDLDADPPVPGVYAFRKRVTRPRLEQGVLVLAKRASTFNLPIAEVRNPVLGRITSITDISVRERLPRARVIAYGPTGFPELDAALVAAGHTPFSTRPRPALLLSAVPWDEFPFDAEGGPDISQLMAQGGPVFDLSTGDPNLSTPAWSPGARVAWGRPDGRLLDIVSPKSRSFVFGGQDATVLMPVFVFEVMLGCLVTFQDVGDDPILSPFQILQLADDPSESVGVVTFERGDTLLVVPPERPVLPNVDDPPTQEQRVQALTGMPEYRVRFDVKVDRTEGEIVDISLPSYSDPSILGLKEILGQRTPEPLMAIEADVRFKNTSEEPTSFPALEGQPYLDNGDESVPYTYTQGSELFLLGEAASAFESLVGDDTPVPSAIYPNEILIADGVFEEGALHTSADLTPVQTLGGYPPHSGIGDPRPWDFVLCQTDQPIPGGSTGLLSIGRVEGGGIYPARFVSPTGLGDRIRYNIRSAISFVLRDLYVDPPGMVVRRVGTVTSFDTNSISQGTLVLNDGSPNPTGGLNNILNPGGAFTYGVNQDNIIRIHLWIPGDPATYLQSIEIRGNINAPTATGDLGPQPINVLPQAFAQLLTVDTPAPFVTIGAGPPPFLPEDPNNPGQSIALWFTIDVDTTAGGNAALPGASLTARVEEDRLTFTETLDFRTTLPRSTPRPDPLGPDVFSTLDVAFVTGKTSDAVTVNAVSETNGGLPFTFLQGGSFASVLEGGDGNGQILVPGWEGFGNIPITGANVRAALIPSSDQDKTGIISQGTGVCDTSFDFRIQSASGALETIVAGDLCVILGSDDIPARASTKAGTYIIRHAIAPNVGLDQREMALASTPVQGSGFMRMVFPRVTQSNIASDNQIFVDNVTLENGSSAWPSSGTLYIMSVLDPNSPNFLTANYRIDYLSLNVPLRRFFVDQATATDFAGALPAADAVAAIDALQTPLVAGMQAFDVRLDEAIEESLPRNTVGFESGVSTAAGFRHVRVQGAAPVVLTFGGADPIVLAPAPLPPNGLRVTSGTPGPAFDFATDPDAIVYDDVPEILEVSLSPAQWAIIHGVPDINALLPSDTLFTDDGGGVDGFVAQAGIFFEPSTPRPVLDLNGPLARVVDAGHSLAPGLVGFRNGPAFGEAAQEPVSYAVRRIRRWHDPQVDIEGALKPLRFAYEVRRGIITAYGVGIVGFSPSFQPHVVQSLGTQLGGFQDPSVNVRAGDTFRLVDSDGRVVETAEIGGVADDFRIWLLEPGLKTPNVVGMDFEIYLRTTPVPHLQSAEQLLEAVTDEVLIDRRASYSNQTGGYVPVGDAPTDPRELHDTLDFVELGVQEGDLLVIDPAGDVQGPTGVPASGQERGLRPFGDRSVPARVVASPGQEVPYVAGGPGQLDDNRGWYRITEVRPDALVVETGTLVTGTAQDPVTFGDVAVYAVYPTVTGSTAPFAFGGKEGQMDLRPTAYAGTMGSPANSFLGNLFSIAPLSYRVLRPTPLLSEEVLDTILAFRERTLSLVELLSGFFFGQKSGSYYIFQRDEHAADLGNPLIPDEGKGVISNALVDTVRGLTSISPFANTSDAVSLLDRRFWCLDSRLDRETPPYQVGVPSYATFEENDLNPSAPVGDGRPVLPDLIDDILVYRDRLRELRYAWIRARVQRVEGSLSVIDRLLRELPKRLLQREQDLRRSQAKALLR